MLTAVLADSCNCKLKKKKKYLFNAAKYKIYVF